MGKWPFVRHRLVNSASMTSLGRVLGQIAIIFSQEKRMSIEVGANEASNSFQQLTEHFMEL